MSSANFQAALVQQTTRSQAPETATVFITRNVTSIKPKIYSFIYLNKLNMSSSFIYKYESLNPYS